MKKNQGNENQDGEPIKEDAETTKLKGDIKKQKEAAEKALKDLQDA